jgi:hypothetical protein
MEERVSEDITDVMQETAFNKDKINSTQNEVFKTQQKVHKIEEVIEKEIIEEKKPWWRSFGEKVIGESIADGDEVQFEIGEGRKGPEAKDVTKIGSAAMAE